jgi:hypothetical protein
MHCCLSTFFLVIFRRRNVHGNPDTLDSLSSLFDIMYYSPFSSLLQIRIQSTFAFQFCNIAIYRRVNKCRVTRPPFWVAQYARLTWLRQIGCMHGDARLIWSLVLSLEEDTLFAQS